MNPSKQIPLRKLAVFDLDHTLSLTATIKLFYRFADAKGLIRPLRWFIIQCQYLFFLLCRWRLNTMTEAVLKILKGKTPKQAKTLLDEFWKGLPEDNFRAELVEEAKNMKNNGFELVMLTACPQIMAQGAADMWGFDYLRGSQVEVKNGRLTGRLIHPVLRGETKLAVLQDEFGLSKADMENSVAYGNENDRPWMQHFTNVNYFHDSDPE